MTEWESHLFATVLPPKHFFKGARPHYYYYEATMPTAPADKLQIELLSLDSRSSTESHPICPEQPQLRHKDQATVDPAVSLFSFSSVGQITFLWWAHTPPTVSNATESPSPDGGQMLIHNSC